MSEEEIEILNYLKQDNFVLDDDQMKALSKLIDLYKNQDKIIHKMAELLKAEPMHPNYGRNVEEVIKYFEKEI